MILLIIFFAVICLESSTNGLPRNIPYDVTQLTSQRIVGGTPAPPTPHMVGLIVGYDYRILICGGSIISTRHVLTAAHCNDAVLTWNGQLTPSLRGVLGSTNISSTEHLVSFTNYKNHPDYMWWIIKNDIGLLYVDGIIGLSKEISPIALDLKYIGGGVLAFATGWGLNTSFIVPEMLQTLDVFTLSESLCQRAMSNAEAIFGELPPVDGDIEICTFRQAGKGMCNGDSGSALVSGGLQIGVVSWGIPCGMGAPDVFVRVSAFIQFIKEAMKS